MNLSCQRTLAAAVLTVALLLSFTPAPAAARCAPTTVERQARTARYVFEGTLVATADGTLTFEVTAVWKGAPPARLTILTSVRGQFAAATDVGRQFLVFAQGSDDAHLAVSRCGASRGLADAAAVLVELRAAGLARRAR
ncbi:MAG: hypothetical protein WCJ30_02835 [Deltaproteobacteria bacterium]